MALPVPLVTAFETTNTPITLVCGVGRANGALVAFAFRKDGAEIIAPATWERVPGTSVWMKQDPKGSLENLFEMEQEIAPGAAWQGHVQGGSFTASDEALLNEAFELVRKSRDIAGRRSGPGPAQLLAARTLGAIWFLLGHPEAIDQHRPTLEKRTQDLRALSAG